MNLRELTVSILLLAISSCSKIHVEKNNSLDTFYAKHLDELAVVAIGKKKQSELNTQSLAFLYLVTDWSTKPENFDHNKQLEFTKQDIEYWRQWYISKKSLLDLKETSRAIDLQSKFFKEGSLDDSELDFLNQLSTRLRTKPLSQSPSFCAISTAEMSKLEKRSKYEIRTVVDFQTTEAADNTISIKGTVRDRRTGEPISALINIVGQKISVTADTDGNFTLIVSKQPLSFEIIHVGYNKFTSQVFNPKGPSMISICLGTTVVK